METRTQAHVCYRLLYHVVWIPKKRWKVLKPGVGSYLEKVVKSVVSDRYPGVVVEEIAVQEEHVHMVVVIPPKYGISRVIGEVKSTSSRKLREKFEYMRRGRDNLWSIGYFVSSMGLDEERIKRYVRYQRKQDEGQLLAVWDEGATGGAKRNP